MPEPLAGKRIVLGVSGGIAAYKAADLTSKLVQLGADVHVVLTSGAREFIQPLTFQALTRNPVHTSVYEGWDGDSAGHVTLAASADLVIVAPATANTIARMAHGFADDMLGAVLLATQAPVIIAPAMEHHMWHHAATQVNLAMLVERGVQVIAPESGYLASGAMGDGRLASIERILLGIRAALGRRGSLAGRRFVMTAGGTHEAIDPVRFIGNSSSGQMGIALAMAAIDRGADVTLILGPTVTTSPAGLSSIRVTSALEMQQAVADAIPAADVLIMAAAVADYRPETVSERKVKKTDGVDAWDLHLVRNPDILAGIQQPGLLKIGFAAETHDLLANAQSKLERKGLDIIVANDAVATIGAATSQATILRRDWADPLVLPAMDKSDLASVILDHVGDLLGGAQA